MAATSVEQGFELRGERSRLGTLLRGLWGSRELMMMLARKDFFVRYRRASLGLIWAIGLPLVQASVYAIVLSQFIRFETAVDFPVFVFAGVLPWTFFNAAIMIGANSVVDGSALATKIYFPRPVLPMVSVLSGLYGLVPGVGILVIMTVVMGNPVGIALLYLIPAMALLFVLSSAFALVFAVLQVYFRDLKHLIGAATLPWFWASGIFYPIDSPRIPERFRDIVEINPAVGMISLFRASIGAAVDGWQTPVYWSLAWAAVLIAAAALLYRRYDRVCVDLL